MAKRRTSVLDGMSDQELWEIAWSDANFDHTIPIIDAIAERVRLSPGERRLVQLLCDIADAHVDGDVVLMKRATEDVERFLSDDYFDLDFEGKKQATEDVIRFVSW